MIPGLVRIRRAGGRCSFRPHFVGGVSELLRSGRVAVFLLLALAGGTSDPSAAAPERSAPRAEAWKAIWIKADQLATDRSIRETVRNAAAWGATDLLVQVRVRGDALYPSRLVPASPTLTARHGSAQQVLTRDPLRLFLDEAHARGLRVHAWFNCFVAWSGPGDPPPEHALAEHPAWALRLTNGRSTLGLSSRARAQAHLEGAYLAPGASEVRRHLLSLVDELVRAYPLDGLHWDYVRYPSDSCLDPADPGGGVIADTTRARSQRDAVSRFVAEAALLARAARPGIYLSAAVRPDPQEAFKEVRQDWARWLREGWIDRAVPMAYTASIYRLDDYHRRAVLAGTDSLRVVYGLGVDRVEAGGLREQLAWARRCSPAGVCLFAYDHLQRGSGAVGAVTAAWRGPWRAQSE
jgi:uncharacterized lipoprotein YddW (UPF0748 family)